MQITIDANRSSAESVLINGMIHAKGFIKVKGKTPLSEKVKAYALTPYDEKSNFIFASDHYGDMKRWQATWGEGATEGDSNFACNGQLIIDASDSSDGYIRDTTLAEHLYYDFYRNHWISNVISLKKVVELAKSSPELWKVQPGSGKEIVLRCRLKGAVADEYDFFIDLQPDWDYLPSRVTSIGGNDVFQFIWKKDPDSGIWYVTKKHSKILFKYPNGREFLQEMTVDVENAKFNQPFNEKNYTFAGLGLNPDSRVSDMRTEPPQKYVYEPTNALANQSVKGSEPIGVANWENYLQLESSYIFLLINATLIAMFCGSFYSRRKSKTRN